VSTCIALGCECFQDKPKAKLVLVMDTKLTLGGVTSVETGLKGQLIGDHWHAMFAGNDISHANTVLSLANSYLNEKPDQGAQDAVNCLTQAFHEVRKKQIEDQVLSSFGWTIEDFLKTGRKQLPFSHFSSFMAEIQNYDLGCQFIFSGFVEENANEPQIFIVENPGVASPRDAIGFACIGAGASNAEAYLTWREQGRYDSLWETVYNGIAAKALSEKAIGVGVETNVLIIPNSGNHGFLKPKNMEEIRAIWEAEEHHYRPENLEKRIKSLVKWEPLI
jgi:hypothetical protein